MNDAITIKTTPDGPITGTEGRESTVTITISTPEEKALKSPFLRDLHKALQDCSAGQPATRSYLRQRLGTSDRRIRKGIQDLREAGLRIIALSDATGYWIDEPESSAYKHMRAEMLKRAFTILATVKAMDGEVEGQLQWEEGPGWTAPSGTRQES